MADYYAESDDIVSNKLGINDPAKLKAVEQQVVAEKSAALLSENPQVFNLEYLLHIHEILFEDLYDFAGQPRTVNIAKPDAPAPFANAQFLQSECDRLFDALATSNYLLGKSYESFVYEITQLSAELNALHPFREGNGRTIRLFLMLLADHAGYLLDYSRASAAELINADKAAFNGEMRPLLALYRKIVSKI